MALNDYATGILSLDDDQRDYLALTLRDHAAAYGATGNFSDTLRRDLVAHLADEVEGGEDDFCERDLNAMSAALKYRRYLLGTPLGATDQDRLLHHYTHAEVQDATPTLTGDPLR